MTNAPRKELIQVRLTADEKTQIEALAKAAGLPASSWLRQAGLTGDSKPRNDKPTTAKKPIATAKDAEKALGGAAPGFSKAVQAAGKMRRK